jgi:hypothetical protein
MKTIASFLVLLTALGCSTANVTTRRAAIVAVHGGVDSWDGHNWVAAHADQTITDGAKIRPSSGSYVDLSAANSLTLRSTASAGSEAGQQHVTRTVLVVQRGCVLVSVGKLAPDSVFEIRGGEVSAEVRQGADFSTRPNGSVTMFSGQVCVTAGEKAAVLHEDGSMAAESRLADLNGRKAAGNHSADPLLSQSFPLSPFDRGLASRY